MTVVPVLPVARSAVISADGRYRYHLARAISGESKSATFIMLNPSKADASVDDPTIRKCIVFCRRWGCGTLQVVNLFAFRAMKPADLHKADDPVGPENPEWIRQALASSDRVVCAWGTHGSYMLQAEALLDWISGRCEPLCLGVTREGHPRHPLYVPYSATLVQFDHRSRVLTNPR